MLTLRFTLAAALLALPVALAMHAYADTHADTEGSPEASCVAHVRTSGVPGATDAAPEVCNTDYIRRYTR